MAPELGSSLEAPGILREADGETADLPQKDPGGGPSSRADRERSEVPGSYWTPSRLAVEAQKLRIAREDPELLRRALVALQLWYERFPLSVWSRMTKVSEAGSRGAPKVLKELDEIAPVLRRVEEWLGELPSGVPPVTVLDLCSGFGFLGMFVAELVQDPHRVEDIVLVDRGWPNKHSGATGSISRDHIDGFGAWRVDLRTIKSDIKQQANIKKIVQKIVALNDRPCLICAVHLCGTLALRAAQIFNSTSRAYALALVPCCLPPKKHRNEELVYTVGSHTFCPNDYRDNSLLPRPPDRFRAWVLNVMASVDAGDEGVKWLEENGIGSRPNHGEGRLGENYPLNLYLFARRAPWDPMRSRPLAEEEVARAGSPVVSVATWKARRREAKDGPSWWSEPLAFE